MLKNVVVIESAIDNIGTDVYDDDFVGISSSENYDYTENEMIIENKLLDYENYDYRIVFKVEFRQYTPVDLEKAHHDLFDLILDNSDIFRCERGVNFVLGKPVKKEDEPGSAYSPIKGTTRGFSMTLYFKEIREIPYKYFYKRFIKKMQIWGKFLSSFNAWFINISVAVAIKDDTGRRVFLHMKFPVNQLTLIKETTLKRLYNKFYRIDEVIDDEDDSWHNYEDIISRVSTCFGNRVVKYGNKIAEDNYGIHLKLTKQFIDPDNKLDGILEVELSSDEADKELSFREMLALLGKCIVNYLPDFILSAYVKFIVIVKCNGIKIYATENVYEYSGKCLLNGLSYKIKEAALDYCHLEICDSGSFRAVPVLITDMNYKFMDVEPNGSTQKLLKQYMKSKTFKSSQKELNDIIKNYKIKKAED